MKSSVETTQARIRELEAALAELKNGAAEPKQPRQSPQRILATPAHSGRIHLAPGFVADTQTGSLYSTLMLVLAQIGKLALHSHLFENFRKVRNTAAARKLLDEIGVPRRELDTAVRRDPLFKLHCEKRTLRLKNLAAQGDRRGVRF